MTNYLTEFYFDMLTGRCKKVNKKIKHMFLVSMKLRREKWKKGKGNRVQREQQLKLH